MEGEPGKDGTEAGQTGKDGDRTESSLGEGKLNFSHEKGNLRIDWKGASGQYGHWLRCHPHRSLHGSPFTASIADGSIADGGCMMPMAL